MLHQTESIAGLLYGLFADAGVGLVLFDRELTYVLVNDALAELNGVSTAEHVGRRPEEVVPALAPALRPVLERALAGETITNLEFDTRGVPDAPGRTTLESYYPLRGPDGAVAGVGGVVFDFSDLRHARDSERYLRELLGEERAVLHEVFARAPAGIALLWGPDDRVRLANDRFRSVAGLEQDPTGRRFAEVLPDLWPIARPLLERVRESGEPVAAEDFRIPAKDPEREHAFEGHRYLTFTIHPVSADAVHSGLLIVVLETTDQVRRRALLERELREERAVVSTLQRALLPRALPPIPGADVAARYEAAGERYDVGGDFYDAFELPGGRWALVVGDVCGKGPEAAALTAMARYTLRAEASHADGPAALLGQLNGEILRHDHDQPPNQARFVTVACAWVQPAAGGLELRIALAGHPDALLVASDGAVRRFASSGPPCGAFARRTYREESAFLAPGEALVFYTDGVLDAGAPARPLGVTDLAEALSGRASAGAEGLTDVLFALVRGSGGAAPRDDCAVVALAATSPPDAPDSRLEGAQRG